MPDDYEIDATRPTHRVGPNGLLIDVVEVSFTTLPEEATGMVRVDMKPGWEQAAAAQIAQRVTEIRALYGV